VVCCYPCLTVVLTATEQIITNIILKSLYTNELIKITTVQEIHRKQVWPSPEPPEAVTVCIPYTHPDIQSLKVVSRSSISQRFQQN
jgi:hypothetical protein